MRISHRQALQWLVPAADLMISPLAYFCASVLWVVRRVGVQRLPRTRGMLLRAGCFPIREHYYEPSFDNESIRTLLSTERNLPGIDWNIAEQLQLLRSFSHHDELATLPIEECGGYEFYLENSSFESGDAEYWYNLIRLKKPKRIIEIGSGFSTRMARRALDANVREDPHYTCEHVLVEPYEHDWLETLGVIVIRDKVENCDLRMFEELDAGDILFIDSSHMIRPRGDVLFEYLEILPMLKVGVIVHIHDIFSPMDYPAGWIVDEVRFWNEQYLLEAFLTSNKDWKVMGALNLLRRHHFDELRDKCVFLTEQSQPGSLYIERVR
jgi:predicted O-methyltransferase YrrM